MGKKKDFAERYKQLHEEAVSNSTAEENIEEVKEEPVEEVKEETENLADAVVDGVAMSLNIRRDPKVEANNQIAILGAGTKIIVVDPDKPILKDGIEWLKVRLIGCKDKKDPTRNGYAMKKYIKVI